MFYFPPGIRRGRPIIVAIILILVAIIRRRRHHGNHHHYFGTLLRQEGVASLPALGRPATDVERPSASAVPPCQPHT
jgi:hypothetical protein